MLGVVQPALGQARVHRVGVGDDGLHVVGDQDLEDPLEERPRRFTAGDDRHQRLRVRQPDEHVPGITGGEDQGVDLPPAAIRRVGEVAQVSEVDLQLHAGLAVGDPDGGVLHAEPAPFGGEPVQRPIGHHTPLPGQQFVDLHHRQRLGVLAVTLEPHRDLLLAGLQGLPRRPVPVRAGRTHHRHHLGDQLVVDRREPRVPLQAGLLRGGDVPAGRLPVHPRPFGDRPQAGALQPAAEHFPDLNHTDLPESHARRPPYR